MVITTAMCRQRTAKVYLYHDKETLNAMARIWKAKWGEGGHVSVFMCLCLFLQRRLWHLKDERPFSYWKWETLHFTGNRDAERKRSKKESDSKKVEEKIERHKLRQLKSLKMHCYHSLSYAVSCLLINNATVTPRENNRMLSQGFQVATPHQKTSQHPFCSANDDASFCWHKSADCCVTAMVLGEWQRSGYRRRVFFSSQTHCGTARRLEWRHRSSQLQSTGLFRGSRGAEHFLSKYCRSAPFCCWGIIFTGTESRAKKEDKLWVKQLGINVGLICGQKI